MHDKDFMRVLAAHGADDVSKCFVLKDLRTGAYAVGVFDENGKPFVLVENDEEFNDGLVQFLLGKNVRIAESVADLALFKHGG